MTVFGRAGEAAARVLTQGWLVAASGRLEYREFETQDGQKRSAYTVVGRVDFLAAPRREEQPVPAGRRTGHSLVAGGPVTRGREGREPPSMGLKPARPVRSRSTTSRAGAHDDRAVHAALSSLVPRHPRRCWWLHHPQGTADTPPHAPAGSTAPSPRRCLPRMSLHELMTGSRPGSQVDDLDLGSVAGTQPSHACRTTRAFYYPDRRCDRAFASCHRSAIPHQSGVALRWR